MKGKTFTVMMVTLLCSCIAFTSCIGSFKLSNKVLSWNKQVSNSKFVNEVVFFCFWVIPVYEVTTIAVFWSSTASSFGAATILWQKLKQKNPFTVKRGNIWYGTNVTAIASLIATPKPVSI